MKKLLAAFMCLSLFLAFGFGTTGCTKKEPEKVKDNKGKTVEPVKKDLPAEPKEKPPSIDLPNIDPPTKVNPTKTDPPKVDPPKVDPPKVDVPKVDPPKVDPPKVDPPKVTPPKVDPPKVDPPKVDPPKVDPPKVVPPPVKGASLDRVVPTELSRLELIPASVSRYSPVGPLAACASAPLA